MLNDKHNEISYINSMLKLLDTHNMVAIVIDTYDMFNFIELISSMKEEIIEKCGNNKTIVLRPDSGDPHTVPIEVISALATKFGYSVNSKGYKVLPSCVRVIQGDGITIESLPIIIDNLLDAGFAIDNLAFGMGGGLLQQVNRDTQKFAMKASHVQFYKDGVYTSKNIYKAPSGDMSKASKAGTFSVSYKNGEWKTTKNYLGDEDMLKSVYYVSSSYRKDLKNLKINYTPFEEIRKRSNL